MKLKEFIKNNKWYLIVIVSLVIAVIVALQIKISDEDWTESVVNKLAENDVIEDILEKIPGISNILDESKSGNNSIAAEEIAEEDISLYEAGDNNDQSEDVSSEADSDDTLDEETKRINMEFSAVCQEVIVSDDVREVDGPVIEYKVKDVLISGNYARLAAMPYMIWNRDKMEGEDYQDYAEGNEELVFLKKDNSDNWNLVFYGTDGFEEIPELREFPDELMQ